MVSRDYVAAGNIGLKDPSQSEAATDDTSCLNIGQLGASVFGFLKAKT